MQNNLVYLIICVHHLYKIVNSQFSSVQVQKIEVNPIEPKPGESVKIRCYLKNVDPTKSSKPDIIWSFKEDNSIRWRILGNGAYITDTFNNRLSGRKESDEVFEIIIRPIQETDVGLIKCEITNTEGQIFKMQQLNVYSAPYINFISSDIYTKVGSKIVLECFAEGYPEPQIKWSRLGEMSAVLFNSRFEITSVGREDRGTYRCMAENMSPATKIKQIAEAYVTVTIDFPPSITCMTDVIYQVAGIQADAELVCTIEGYPLSRVRWYFQPYDNNIELEIQTDKNYRIENIIPSLDNIKSTLLVRNVDRSNYGLYTIKVEGGQQIDVERAIRLEPIVNFEAYVNTACLQNIRYYIHILLPLLVVIFL